MQSLLRAVGEEMVSLWASISADLIKFFKSKDLGIYTKLADALETMASADDEPTTPTLTTPSIPTIASLMTASTRAHAFLFEIPRIELDFFKRHWSWDRGPSRSPAALTLWNLRQDQSDSSTLYTDPLGLRHGTMYT